MSITQKPSLEAYKDFEIRIHQQGPRRTPGTAERPSRRLFVDGEMNASTRKCFFSALRDIVYTENELDAHAST